MSTGTCVDTIRTLSMDAVQRAGSGHPGTPMALAPIGYVLYTRVMRHSPAHPHWPNRDRFVLSAGHASMLLYSLLYLTGYEDLHVTVAESILRVARENDAQAVVLGVHGHGGISEAILGSTSRDVIRHAHCPVVVARDSRV